MYTLYSNRDFLVISLKFELEPSSPASNVDWYSASRLSNKQVTRLNRYFVSKVCEINVPL